MKKIWLQAAGIMVPKLTFLAAFLVAPWVFDTLHLGVR